MEYFHNIYLEMDKEPTVYLCRPVFHIIPGNRPTYKATLDIDKSTIFSNPLYIEVDLLTGNVKVVSVSVPKFDFDYVSIFYEMYPYRVIYNYQIGSTLPIDYRGEVENIITHINASGIRKDYGDKL